MLLPACNSSHPWRPLGKLLDLYVLPAVCLSGLFLNVACIVVFVQRKTVVLYFSATGHGQQWPPSERKFSRLSPEASSVETSPPQRSRLTSTGEAKSLVRGTRLGSVLEGEGQQTQSMAADSSMAPVRITRAARRRSHPLVPVLIMLCCCDSLQLLFSLLVLYLPALHDHLEMDPLGPVAQIAYLATGGLAGGLLAANCASIWTMCFISFQRHRAIVRPLSNFSASQSTSHLPLLLIALCALLFNLPVWFEFLWHVDWVEMPDGRQRLLVWHQLSSLAQNELYRFLMHKVLYPICVYLIPLVLISVLNTRILVSLHCSARVQCVGHRRRMAKERRSVWLLISIVLLFFLCHTGGLIIRLVDLRQHSNKPCFVVAKDLVNFLFNINSFANPMLYFFFTKQFRDLRTTWATSTSRNSTALVNTTNGNGQQHFGGGFGEKGPGAEHKSLLMVGGGLEA